ncbi:MAG: hypothetical protein IPI81_14570 [Flavobacteriales bacterium]|nr:hypothetical protein [Flavobacteriales bacterium]MCC6937841.1 hypothetical protein [Flavobacteriales bacterium]
MRNTWKALAMLSLLGVMADACKHGKCEGGGTSSHGSTRSHNVGENCMSCHHPDGEGHGCWQIGGTVYYSDHHTTLSNAKLLLFTLPQGQGTFVRSIDVDGLGNVYTSDKIPFDQTIFPAILIPSGDTAFMTEPIHDGACNRCHGVSTERITGP